MLGTLEAACCRSTRSAASPTSRSRSTARCTGTSLACGARSGAASIAPPAGALDSIGVDTWGCDYALLDERGKLLEKPYHYRDARTNGVMEAVWQRVSREEIYAITGIQFLVVQHALSALRRVPRRRRS